MRYRSRPVIVALFPNHGMPVPGLWRVAVRVREYVGCKVLLPMGIEVRYRHYAIFPTVQVEPTNVH